MIYTEQTVWQAAAIGFAFGAIGFFILGCLCGRVKKPSRFLDTSDANKPVRPRPL